MDKISKHINYTEATRSDTAKRSGIPNTPSNYQLDNMKRLAENVFEPLREHFNTPIFIASFYRSNTVNALMGGVANSQHISNNGSAIDLDADVFNVISNNDIFNYIKDNLDFDQLIAEDIHPDGTINWVHVSYNENHNRHEILTMTIIGDTKKYETYRPVNV
jgi:hypothetical protein